MQEYNQLPSKKNQIYLNKKIFPYEIIKVFANQDSFAKELYLYTILSKRGLSEQIKTARLIDSVPEKKTIHLSYLKGETLLFALEAAESKADLMKAKQLLLRLINWLQSFDKLLRPSITNRDLIALGIDHEQLSDELLLSPDDLNFRNFIIVDDEVFGLDFEQIELTDRLTQFALLFAYMLLYDPIDSDFKIQLLADVTMVVAAEQAIDQGQLLAEVAKQVQILYERRTSKHRN